MIYHKQQKIPKRQSTMDNLEKLPTYSTQDEEKQNKNATQNMLDNIMRKHTHMTLIRYELSTNNWRYEKNRTSFLCGNRNGHHNTEHRT